MNAIERVLRSISAFMNMIAGAGIFVVMVVVVLNIILRLLFNSPIDGTYEIVQYGILLAISLALADNELADGNVMVSFLLEKMKPRVANIFLIAMNIIALITMGFITFNQFRMVATKYANRAATSILHIPHWILVLILALGFLTLVLALLLKLITLCQRHKSLPDHTLTPDEIAEQSSNPGGNNF